MTKSLYDLSWQVTEAEYRKDPALSYSTLAKYKRSGFNGLDHLYDKTESPSLTFGSAVDSIITGGMEEFEERFMVAEFPLVGDKVVSVVKELFLKYGDKHNTLTEIPDNDIIKCAELFSYQNNWKPETRAKVIREQGSEYYKLLYIATDKTILDTRTYQDILNCVEALRNSPNTRFYFAPNNPFERIERFYQLKFKASSCGVNYRCMADLIIVDHDNKVIVPVDLKTSFKPEWDFYKSFLEWDYQIQARLYWRIIRANLDKDPIYRNYTLKDYVFIVVNKVTLNPLKWVFTDTRKRGDITYPNGIVLRDPECLGRELDQYLRYSHRVPIGVTESEYNDIVKYISV